MSVKAIFRHICNSVETWLLQYQRHNYGNGRSAATEAITKESGHSWTSANSA